MPLAKRDGVRRYVVIKFWTERARGFQEALERSFLLRATFTAYSFITLLFFAPVPALGSPSVTEIAPAVKIHGCFTLSLPGGDPAALECRDQLSASRLVDFVAQDACGSHAAAE